MSQVDFTAIMACTNEGIIGKEDTLPWGKPNAADMRWFRDATMGRECFISDKTFKTIPGRLPGRNINIITRPDTKFNTDLAMAKHVISLNPEAFNVYNPPILLGGATIYRKYLGLVSNFMVTFIQGNHKGDKTFDLKEFTEGGWDVAFAGQSKHEGGVTFIHFVKSQKGKVDKTLTDTINEHFEPYTKLTVKKSISIKPGAHGVVDINEFVGIPNGATGAFSIRKKLGDQGILTTSTGFKSNWRGYPQIVVSNRGLEEITIKTGEELGELAFLQNFIAK